MGLIKVNRGQRPIQEKDKLTKDNKRLDAALRKNARPLGLNGDELIEPIPVLNPAACEETITKGNSSIVLGRDRNGALNSGYMGATATGASSIDVVVGRGSSHKPFGKEFGSPPGSDIMVNPNFFTDAARIYISQKADIDEYFGICETKYEPEGRSTARSAIGVKADCVRIIGRNNVKIVTGKGIGGSAPNDGELNSAGGKIDGPGTISLIAGNYVEGHTITKLPFFKKVNANSQGITELAGAVGTHFHEYGGGFGPTTNASILGAKMIPTYIKSFNNLKDNFSSTYNQGRFQTDFLTKNSPYYINSRHVFTT